MSSSDTLSLQVVVSPLHQQSAGRMLAVVEQQAEERDQQADQNFDQLQAQRNATCADIEALEGLSGVNIEARVHSRTSTTTCRANISNTTTCSSNFVLFVTCSWSGI